VPAPAVVAPVVIAPVVTPLVLGAVGPEEPIEVSDAETVYLSSDDASTNLARMGSPVRRGTAGEMSYYQFANGFVVMTMPISSTFFTGDLSDTAMAVAFNTATPPARNLEELEEQIQHLMEFLNEDHISFLNQGQADNLQEMLALAEADLPVIVDEEAVEMPQEIDVEEEMQNMIDAIEVENEMGNEINKLHFNYIAPCKDNFFF
jgi:hypothetical protein